jgi:hypothetical protein
MLESKAKYYEDVLSGKKVTGNFSILLFELFQTSIEEEFLIR